MYKRPLMVLFLKLYNLCDFGTANAARDVNVIEHLSRSAAQELQLAAIHAPTATTDLRSQVSPVVAALDASPSAGAIVETKVGKDIASALWRHSERKGTFSRFETQSRTLLREKGFLNASDDVADFSDMGPGTLSRRGPDAFVYDVWTPCSGSTQIPGACLQSGLAVSLPSGDWDSAWVLCSDVDFLDFLVWLLVDGRVNVVLVHA